MVRKNAGVTQCQRKWSIKRKDWIIWGSWQESAEKQADQASRPTMRWIFQCFEGIDLLHIRGGSRWQTQVLGLQTLHQRILRVLRPAYSQCYFLSVNCGMWGKREKMRKDMYNTLRELCLEEENRMREEVLQNE